MRGRITRKILIALIMLAIGALLFYSLARNSDQVKGHDNYSVEFNNSEKEYLLEHDTINIYVDESLQYLVGEDDRGYLPDYLEELLQASGLQVTLSGKEQNADCSLRVITDKIREDSDKILYTAPIFQVVGKLYVNEDYCEDEVLSGVVMSGRMSKEELDKLTYNGKNIHWKTVDTAEEAVDYATKNHAACILGDKSAITNAFAETSNYTGAKEKVYSCNACIITDSNEVQLRNVINQCIHSVDKHYLSNQKSEKWLKGTGPVYMQNDYENIYVLILIIIAAILIAFYIYYQSNKNLYAELTDRMNKLTESKKELQTTFNGVDHFMAELSLDGDIIDINKAFYRFLKANVVNKKIWRTLDLNADDSALFQNAFSDTNEGAVIQNLEIKAGSKTLIIDIFPIENAKGVAEKLLFMAVDVTNERMAERQMLQDNKMIAVGQLAAGVAHEIRNPLGIIRNYCYVIKNMKDETVRAKAVSQIEKAVDNSSSIINNLLDFSRVSAGRDEQIDLEKHIKSLLALNKSLFKKKNINLQIRCEDKIETYIAVESLDMVLINLVSNAGDAMEEEGDLIITMKRDKADFTIYVEDTGEGIGEDIIEDIFNPFFTTKGGKGGTGLGLYIVYNEINKMDGKIQVESEPGQGTRFTVVLPMKTKGDIEKK